GAPHLDRRTHSSVAIASTRRSIRAAAPQYLQRPVQGAHRGAIASSLRKGKPPLRQPARCRHLLGMCRHRRAGTLRLHWSSWTSNPWRRLLVGLDGVVFWRRSRQPLDGTCFASVGSTAWLLRP